MSLLWVAESYEHVMGLLDERRDGHDAQTLYAAPLVRVTGVSVDGRGSAPLAFAAHAVVAVCGLGQAEPSLPDVPDAPPDWLSETTRDDEA